MKITRRDNFRVIIEVDSSYIGEYFGGRRWVPTEYGVKAMAATAEDIVAQVKRHVDNAESVGIDYDTIEICSYCGLEWETNGDPDDPDWELGQPVCCDKAIEEWKSKEDEPLRRKR